MLPTVEQEPTSTKLWREGVSVGLGLGPKESREQPLAGEVAGFYSKQSHQPSVLGLSGWNF